MKYLKIFITFKILFLIFFHINCQKSSQEPIHEEKVIVTTTLDNVTQSDIDRVEKEANIGLDSVCSILEIKYDSKIRIQIVEEGICHVENGIIYLPIWHVQNKKAAIVHEVTHIIAKHGDNRFFSEGIAVYFQERFGEDNGFPNFEGIPLDDLLNHYKDKLIPITNLVNNNQIFYQVGTEDRKIAYIEAGSFFNFLVITYEENKLKYLHNSFYLNYNEIYGKTLEELETEWKEYVLED